MRPSATLMHFCALLALGCAVAVMGGADEDAAAALSKLAQLQAAGRLDNAASAKILQLHRELRELQAVEDENSAPASVRVAHDSATVVLGRGEGDMPADRDVTLQRQVVDGAAALVSDSSLVVAGNVTVGGHLHLRDDDAVSVRLDGLLEENVAQAVDIGRLMDRVHDLEETVQALNASLARLNGGLGAAAPMGTAQHPGKSCMQIKADYPVRWSWPSCGVFAWNLIAACSPAGCRFRRVSH